MSGDQVAASIKNVEADIPVIMLTGFGEMMNSRRRNAAKHRSDCQ